MDLSLLKIEMWQHNKLKLSIIVEAITTRAAFHTGLLRCSLLLSLPCIRHHFDISLDPIMHSALRQLLVIRCLRWWRPACRIDANPITRVTRLRLSIQTLCASPDGTRTGYFMWSNTGKWNVQNYSYPSNTRPDSHRVFQQTILSKGLKFNIVFSVSEFWNEFWPVFWL